jgi:hypothetical protein
MPPPTSWRRCQPRKVSALSSQCCMNCLLDMASSLQRS